MKLVVLDGYTENPGDLSWDALKEFGDLTVYDRTSFTESPLITERIGDAEIIITNKTPISRETIDKCPRIKLIALSPPATMSSTITTPLKREFLS